MLEIKNLTYKYENHIALNNINLKIEKGEKIAILGNNGSGKTTFFLCCNGVYKTKNAVSFNGDYEPKTLRRNVGLVFQDADTDNWKYCRKGNFLWFNEFWLYKRTDKGKN